MDRSKRAAWLRFVALVFLGCWLMLGAETFEAAAQDPAQQPQTSGGVGASIGSSVKSGFSKVADFFTPEEELTKLSPELSLSSDTKPTAKSHTQFARHIEKYGRYGEAESHYAEAMKLEPENADVYMAYAQYLDRRNKLDDALKQYDKALTLRPNDPAINNHLGLCFARHGELNASLKALQRAIAVKPDNVLYRNNIAIVLVRLGQMDQARRHLVAVHPPGIAYYNLGHALHQNGQIEQAAHFFRAALNEDPTMVHARIWLDSLARTAENTHRPPEYQGYRPSAQSAPSNPAVGGRYNDGSVGGRPVANPSPPGVSPYPGYNGGERNTAPRPTAPSSVAPGGASNQPSGYNLGSIPRR